jgi:hypothetical protein
MNGSRRRETRKEKAKSGAAWFSPEGSSPVPQNRPGSAISGVRWTPPESKHPTGAQEARYAHHRLLCKTKPQRVRHPIQKPVAPAKWTLISLFPEWDFREVSEISLVR